MQKKFLADAGIDERAALLDFNLAPLATRRDIAMLGVIHRSVLGLGPNHFAEFFKLADEATTSNARHNRQLVDPRRHLKGHLLIRSALGLIAVYNLLPRYIVDCTSVKAFQSQLQLLVASRAKQGTDDWQCTLSPREPLWRHPLL